ncbi:MAG: type IV pili twitching motility protein PilT [Candidatus Cloacimonetes bacterium 4572_55]|nr:MAG: type IV pili twitching motility protein PilT [Candidatus Cloacimonetes bacterium 4572_55]
MNLKVTLELMITHRGSDLHLRAGYPPCIRVDGEIRRVGDVKLKPKDVEQTARAIMTPDQQAQFDKTNEIDFAFGVLGLGRFRTNIYRQRGTLSVNMRAIPKKVASIDELCLPKILKKLATLPRGLILVTGVTGSGKSTTLAAMVSYINNHSPVNIITIEDPIEFIHQEGKALVSQREIGVDTESYSTALRFILRQDPDVILLGEIRDQETTRVALMAADSGHLVMSTLHTLDAPQTIQRMVSYFPPYQHDQVRRQIASTIQAIVSQRLLPKKNDKGRAPAVEVLIGTKAIRDYITDPAEIKSIHGLIEEGGQYGMQSFDQAVIALYRGEMISYETGLLYASSPDEFRLQVEGIQSSTAQSWEQFAG